MFAQILITSQFCPQEKFLWDLERGNGKHSFLCSKVSGMPSAFDLRIVTDLLALLVVWGSSWSAASPQPPGLIPQLLWSVSQTWTKLHNEGQQLIPPDRTLGNASSDGEGFGRDLEKTWEQGDLEKRYVHRPLRRGRDYKNICDPCKGSRRINNIQAKSSCDWQSVSPADTEWPS